MCWVEKAVQEADCHRLYFSRCDFVGDCPAACLIKWLRYFTVHRDAFCDFEDAVGRDWTHRFDPAVVIFTGWHIVATNLQNTPEASRRHKREAGRLALDDGVGGDRRSMHHAVEGRWIRLC